MSKAHEVDFACPECGARNRTALWTRVDAVMDPNLVDRILDGSLFEATCRGCREATTLDHSVLFYDSRGRAAFWYDREDDLVGPQERAETEVLLGLVGAGGRPYALRKAGNLDALKELVHVWRAHLDDAAMLLMKHALAAQIERDVGTPPVLCSFDRLVGSERNGCLEYVVYQTETSDPESLSVPARAYRQLADALAGHRDALFPAGRWMPWDAATARAAWDALRG